MVYKSINIIADTGLTEEEIVPIIEEEIQLWKNRKKTLGTVYLRIDGDHIEVEAFEKSPIRRVRRITGYLSTLDKFNDAKLAEVKDRMAHIE